MEDEIDKMLNSQWQILNSKRFHAKFPNISVRCPTSFITIFPQGYVRVLTMANIVESVRLCRLDQINKRYGCVACMAYI
jgi:hypothetical protein